jgi:hypothetical protein
MTMDITSAPTEAPGGETEDVYYLTAIPALAATAHLLRRRLLDLIDVYRPATTAQLADRTRQPAHIVAHHLGILRDAHLIEQTAEPADDSDAQPWRLSAAANRTMTNDLPDDPVSKAVVLAAQLVSWERHSELFSNWMTAREGFADEWRASAFASDMWLWLSPAELGELCEEVCELINRWARRDLPEDNLDRRPVLVLAQAVRAEP